MVLEVFMCPVFNLLVQANWGLVDFLAAYSMDWFVLGAVDNFLLVS